MTDPTPRETADHSSEVRNMVADHAELARLAEAATQGEWRAADWDADDGENLWTIEAIEPEVLAPGQSSIWPEGVRCKRIAQTEEGENPTEDAAFIAAANPATVLALLSEIAALRGELEASREEADRLAYNCDDARLVSAENRATQAERQRDELRKALEEISETAQISRARHVACRALANQGADK